MGGKDFSLEACRSMVAMVDRDRNGKLDYEEFRSMWTTVMQYKSNFKTFDKDGSGDMNAVELRGKHCPHFQDLHKIFSYITKCSSLVL